MTLTRPEGQCIACGSLPGDEDCVECDFCCFGFEEAGAVGVIGEWALAIFLTLTIFYFVAHIYFWSLRGFSVMP